MRSAKDFLESVRDALMYEEQLKERLTMAASRLNGVGGIQYTDTPKSPNACTDGIFNMICVYQKIIDMLDESVGFSAMLVDQAWEMMQCMRADGCDQMTVDVLEWYYLWCMDDDWIAERIGKSKSRVRHLRVEMLAAADVYVPLYAA